MFVSGITGAIFEELWALLQHQGLLMNAQTLCTGYAFLRHILIDTALRYTTFVGSFPYGEITFHTPFLFDRHNNTIILYTNIRSFSRIRSEIFVYFLIGFEKSRMFTVVARKEIIQLNKVNHCYSPVC